MLGNKKLFGNRPFTKGLSQKKLQILTNVNYFKYFCVTDFIVKLYFDKHFRNSNKITAIRFAFNKSLNNYSYTILIKY